MMRTDMAQSYLIIWLTDGPYILSLEKVTKKLSGWYAKEEDFAQKVNDEVQLCVFLVTLVVELYYVFCNKCLVLDYYL